MTVGQTEFVWSPQMGPQAMAIMSGEAIDELFYGGAAGGGKSDFLLADAVQDVEQGSDWVGIIFRRHTTDMDELIHRSMEIYGPMGGEYKVGIRTWRFPGGAEIRLRHMDTDADFMKYMGHSYAYIGWDELPTWDSLRPYQMMKSRLRGPAQHKRIRATGNPGGKCHGEVKRYFAIDKYPDGYVPLQDKESKMVRCFIPARVQDNRALLDADPDYPNRLMGMGDPELTAAYLDGNWDVSLGAMFSAMRSDLLVDPFEVPENWPLFMAMDYGENNPTAAVLLAVDYDDDVWVVSSYYSSGAGAEHARGIEAMIDECRYTSIGGAYGRQPRLLLAPGDMWTRRAPGDVSQARAPVDTFRDHGLPLSKANMDRVNGWRNIANLLYAGRLKFFRGSTERVVDSLLSLQRESRNPEDASSGDDHGADALRYGINHVYKARKVEDRPLNDGGRLIDQLADDLIESRYG